MCLFFGSSYCSRILTPSPSLTGKQIRRLREFQQRLISKVVAVRHIDATERDRFTQFAKVIKLWEAAAHCEDAGRDGRARIRL